MAQAGVGALGVGVAQAHAGAQRVDGVEQVDQASGEARPAEGSGVLGAVVAAVRRGVQAGERLGGELDVLVARHPRAVLVVGRAVLADQPRLEQQRGELGARLEDVEAVEELEGLAGAVGLTLHEVVAGPAAQVLGLADVELVTVGVAHDVHAGAGRQPLGEHDLVVVAPRSRLAEAHDLFEGGHTLFLQAGEQQQEDLGRGEGVVEGPVARLDGRVEAFGQGAERAAHGRQQPAGEAQRVERGSREGAAHEHAELVVEKAQVETGVVGHQDRVGRELEKARQDLFDRRLADEHLAVDAGDLGDLGRHRLPGVDELREGRDLAALLEAHGADLGDLGEARRAAGGLEVDDCESDGRQVAPLGVPLPETDVERSVPHEPFVVAHDVGDEGAHEFGGAVGHAEETRPDLAVIEGFAGLLEKSDQLVDRHERQLHRTIVARLRGNASLARRAGSGRG